MPISYTLSNFRQYQQINEHNPAKQSYQIWREKFFRRYQVITFYVLCHFLAAPCICHLIYTQNRPQRNRLVEQYNI